jgi:alcohol dehydrogenase YqhD (iron-dependent ADH family)
MKYGMEVQEDPNNYQVRAEIMWASKIVHDGTLGVGRVEDWASHSIEHEISSQYDITHAAGLAVINPNWMKYVYKNNIDRFIQYANRVFDVPTEGRDPEGVVLEGIAKFQEFLSKMKMPLTMRDLGITEKTYFKVMADKVTRYTGGTEGNFVKLTAADVEAIYELAY